MLAYTHTHAMYTTIQKYHEFKTINTLFCTRIKRLRTSIKSLINNTDTFF